jgi:Rap1a immunity proteins
MLRPQLRLGWHGIVVIAALTLSGGTVSAEQDVKSANFVMPGCRAFLTDDEGAGLFLEGWCGGLVSGLVESESNCAPSAVTPRQLVRVVVQYVDARPARMHESFKKLALEALKAAWPCKP